jgi:hypothetical protein
MSLPKCVSKIPLYYGRGGRPSTFQAVTEWRTPGPEPSRREKRRGEALLIRIVVVTIANNDGVTYRGFLTQFA